MQLTLFSPEAHRGDQTDRITTPAIVQRLFARDWEPGPLAERLYGRFVWRAASEVRELRQRVPMEVEE